MSEPTNGCWIKHAKWSGAALGLIFGAIITVLAIFANRLETAASASETRTHAVLKAQEERIRQNEQYRESNKATLEAVKNAVDRIERKIDGRKP